MIGGIVSHIDQQSYSKDAILSTNYADDYAVRGHGFLLQKNFTMLSATTLYLLLDYTTYLGTNKFIFIKPAIFTTSSGPVSLRR